MVVLIPTHAIELSLIKPMRRWDITAKINMKKIVIIILCLCLGFSCAATSETLTINKSIISFRESLEDTFVFKITSPSLDEPIYVTVVLNAIYRAGSSTINLPAGTYAIEEVNHSNFTVISKPKLIKTIIDKDISVNFINILRR